MSETETMASDPGSAPLAAALARFQAEMPTVPKTKRAEVRTDKGNYSYTYADLADVTAAALPLLTGHGLSFATCPRYTEHGWELVGVLLHESGESMEAALPIGGGTPQAMGSALTYARRYLLGCMTGVVTDDDDDGQTASRPAKKAAAKKAAAPAGRVPGGAYTKQIQRIGILMSELGLSEREAALDYVEQAIGRRVGSRNDLTEPEARSVIKALETRGVSSPRKDSGVAAPAAATSDPTIEGRTPPDPSLDADGGEDHPSPATSPPSPDEQEETPAGMVTRLQLRFMFVLFGRLGLGDLDTDRDERLRLIGLIVGRPVESSAQLTFAEGQKVLDTLALAGTSLAKLQAIIDGIPPAGPSKPSDPPAPLDPWGPEATEDVPLPPSMPPTVPPAP